MPCENNCDQPGCARCFPAEPFNPQWIDAVDDAAAQEAADWHGEGDEETSPRGQLLESLAAWLRKNFNQ